MTRWLKALALAGLLLLTTTGGAVAAKKLTGRDIKDGTITSADLKNHSLLAKDFKPGQVPAGPRGPAGPAGPINVGGLVRVESSATVIAGDVDGVTVACPAGYAVVSGSFADIAADGEVFFADTFGSKTSWSVGLDNFDSTLDGTVTAVAFCAPSGRAVVATTASHSASKLAALIKARIASHG
jgi:hypothetical protein